VPFIVSSMYCADVGSKDDVKSFVVIVVSGTTVVHDPDKLVATRTVELCAGQLKICRIAPSNCACLRLTVTVAPAAVAPAAGTMYEKVWSLPSIELFGSASCET